MNSRTELKDFLNYKAYQIRRYSLMMTSKAGSGHPSSCLSAADLVAALFFYGMKFDPNNFENPNNDRFILSKGHAAPVLYSAWELLGKVSEDELMAYRDINSVLEGHPTRRFAYTEAATGALGIGLSVGAGMALNAKMDGRDYYTYVLLGDGEIAEGCIWEAAEIADHYKLNNLIGIVDCNRLGQSTESIHDHHVQRYAQQFHAFGWKTIVVDGHDMQQIIKALDDARVDHDTPVMIIAKTFKGHGVNLFEDKEGYHGKALNKEQLAQALNDLKTNFPHAADFDPKSYDWQPQLPKSEKFSQEVCAADALRSSHYKKDEMIATRKAYGMALAALGGNCKSVISLDAEVKNSTFAEIFEEKFPQRFVQCFIAEQNMISMGVGFDRRGKIPFISTFAAFFSRAYDQVRMAAISKARLRLVGSHVGVSIGQDGPSQMGLEDIAIMRALPESIVLYPSDAVSTHQLVGQMAAYTAGISYMRTTRMDTPVIYDVNEQFPIGGCKIVRQSEQDLACVVAAGVTLHEALKAYDILQKEGISIAVIDLYCIKPLDNTTIETVAKASGNKIITVEDHYLQGGLGEAVGFALRHANLNIDCLAVTQLPRSGKPEELLAWAGIDAAAIVKAVKKS